MKESEMSAPHEWQLAWVTHKIAGSFYAFQANIAEEGSVPMPTNTMKDILDLDEKVLQKEKCLILGFQSVPTWGWMDSWDHDDG